MSRIVKSFQKTPIERRRLYLDYTCWLEETETLVGTQVVIVPFTEDAPLSISTGYTDVTNKKIAMFASGGVANTNYTVAIIVTTSDGQTKRDDIGIRVTT